jgi:hypothetical protein
VKYDKYDKYDRYDDIGHPLKWSLFFNYESIEAWAHAGQYLHDIRTMRGSVRRDRELRPCNEASGEIDAK